RTRSEAEARSPSPVEAAACPRPAAALPGHAIVTVRPYARGHAVARSMWKGAIQFGLVTIPIKLYLATESSYQVRFHMLHDKDQSRIQMKTWCPVDEEIISRADTVKGY